ncbi:hypothetical protein N9997_01575 [Synechococcus sp. AH-603-L18]|nr:hypothetical protein [Synechococcus sp. AH-603-L18]
MNYQRLQEIISSAYKQNQRDDDYFFIQKKDYEDYDDAVKFILAEENEEMKLLSAISHIDFLQDESTEELFNLSYEEEKKRNDSNSFFMNKIHYDEIIEELEEESSKISI